MAGRGLFRRPPQPHQRPRKASNLDLDLNQSVALSPATITVTGQAMGVTAAKSVALAPATITVTAQALDVVAEGGDVSRALAPATITVTGQAMGVSLGGVSVALSPATIIVTGKAMGVTVGAASVELSPATITVTAQTLGVEGVAEPEPEPEDETRPGSRHDVSKETRDYWKREGERLREIRELEELIMLEDEEILLLA